MEDLQNDTYKKREKIDYLKQFQDNKNRCNLGDEDNMGLDSMPKNKRNIFQKLHKITHQKIDVGEKYNKFIFDGHRSLMYLNKNVTSKKEKEEYKNKNIREIQKVREEKIGMIKEKVNEISVNTPS